MFEPDELNTITDEEMFELEQEFLHQQRYTCRKLRKEIHRLIRLTFEMPTNQKNLRQLSQTHAREYLNDPVYRSETFQLLRKLTPIPMCSSGATAYHMHHFIAAAVLAILRPGIKSLSNSNPELPERYCIPGDDEYTAVTMQEQLLTKLQARLHKSLEAEDLVATCEEPAVNETLEQRVFELEHRVVKLETWVSNHDN